ncbi:hypothetical protein EV384_5192 [Micromonospora kangleipakensis]|uniref:Uncharacterized protein n=1 Tax=Micromonospora kangleipakensis TaxID=1077942 RepID=A0A4Q8BEZ8_9ACTN|nr:hypothetical protein EV384_5192 [Micromonospora kangleipakensis]
MHGCSAIDDDRRIRPARTDAPLTAHPAAPRSGRTPVRPAARVTRRRAATGPVRLVAALR